MPPDAVQQGEGGALDAKGGVDVAAAEHAVYCFDVLTSHFLGEDAPAPEFDNSFCPLFVTWNKESRSGELRLRGCIGCLEPRHLHTGLRDYALTSALRDRRFNPVQHKELPQLHCTVSLLHHFEAARGWEDWEVGTHGLIIEFTDPLTRKACSATFLPHVAAEEGWSKVHTIDCLVRKAGYAGAVTPDIRQALKVTRYRSTAFSLSYAEYAEHRAVSDIGRSRMLTVAA